MFNNTNGGYVLVDGPTSNGDSALDYDGELVITKEWYGTRY